MIEMKSYLIFLIFLIWENYIVVAMLWYCGPQSNKIAAKVTQGRMLLVDRCESIYEISVKPLFFPKLVPFSENYIYSPFLYCSSHSPISEPLSLLGLKRSPLYFVSEQIKSIFPQIWAKVANPLPLPAILRHFYFNLDF